MANCTPVDSCACDNHCCIADTEEHYFLSFTDTTGIWLDSPSNGSIPNRIAIELYNDGTVDLQFANAAGFQYGVGRTLKPGASVTLAIGPHVRHYVACSTGTCLVHVTELGKSQ